MYNQKGELQGGMLFINYFNTNMREEIASLDHKIIIGYIIFFWGGELIILSTEKLQSCSI